MGARTARVVASKVARRTVSDSPYLIATMQLQAGTNQALCSSVSAWHWQTAVSERRVIGVEGAKDQPIWDPLVPCLSLEDRDEAAVASDVAVRPTKARSHMTRFGSLMLRNDLTTVSKEAAP